MVVDMFRVGKLDINDINYKYTIIFFLKKISNFNFESPILLENSEWHVGIVEGSKAIYASTNNKLETIDLFYNCAYLAVQRFLDKAILIKKPAMSVENDKDKQISLYISSEDNYKTLNIFAKNFQKFEIELKVEARDNKGNLIPPKFAINDYKPSVRYFRMSQLSEGLLDAYRYLYLAVESALNDFHPIKSGEREREWIGRAVKLANSKSKNPLIYDQYSGIDEYFMQYHYKQFRLKLFHSKKEILLPLDYYNLTEIYNAYVDLFEICAMVFEVQYGFNIKGGSHFTEHAIRAAVEGLKVDGITLFKDNVCSDLLYKINNITQFSAQGYKGHMKIEMDIINKQNIAFDRYDISLDNEILIKLDLDETIQCEGFDFMIVNHEIMFTNRNIIDRPFLW